MASDGVWTAAARSALGIVTFLAHWDMVTGSRSSQATTALTRLSHWPTQLTAAAPSE